ncbi:Mu transposase C-terminal domain-containing protein [Micrococcus luteus]|uniref:Mu transposase C-terminal domain-containing protein n=1 Tax=Micrococcus luteus TaxID=1270 RepID=UPI00211C31A3|nr:Mu transposase C-terminal domain-containing protein [Micrococcus luteus]
MAQRQLHPSNTRPPGRHRSASTHRSDDPPCATRRIRFASTRYISPVLAAYVGEDVTVRYDPRDLGEIRIFHENTFLCRAIAPERSSETVSFADLQTARNARRRALKQQLRELTTHAGSLPEDTRHQTEIPTMLASTLTSSRHLPRDTD